MRRQVKQVLQAVQVTEGAGVRLHRVFGFNETPLFDPFLMLDDFRSDSPEEFIRGFPWHPHRGIETITYVLKGEVEHGDSLGNTGRISAGDIQWMTAGSGIIHQEMPKGDEHGSMHGFQLWADLPAGDKMMEPRYRDITAAGTPTVQLDSGVCIKVIAGQFQGVSGPADDIVIDPQYLDCTVPAGVEFSHPVKRGYTVFVYCIGGQGRVNSTRLTNRTLILFDDGDEVALRGGDNPLRFLLFAGKPLNQPIAWRGPIVMNSQEELDLAYQELQEDTFIKHD